MHRLLVLIAILAIALPAAPPAAASPLPRAGEQAWSVALHVHGSFSEGDGSMEWQADQARQWGVDALWWTDHDWRLANWHHTRTFDFEAATHETTLGTITEPDAEFPGGTRAWVRLEEEGFGRMALVDSLAHEGTRSLRLSATDGWHLPDFSYFTLEQWSSRKRNRYSLATRVRLRFAIYPETLDPADDKFVVEARLSLHPEGQHVLRYVAGSQEEEGGGTIPLAYVPGEWNEIELDITGDAIERFTSGGADSLRAVDNSLYSIRIGMETRLDGAPVVFFDDYRVEWDETLSADDLLDEQRDLAAAYEQTISEVQQFVGMEISLFQPQPHVNAYGPGLRIVDYDGRDPVEPLDWAVDEVRAQGGITSLNHLFGTWIYAHPDETPEERAARLLARTRATLENRALGCDILEVGYRSRGGASLTDHLDLWDVLTANAVFITADGVSDTHGTEPFHGWGPWEVDFARVNNLVTWVWAEALEEAALVRALRGGRATFGDPYEFSGTLDLATGEGFPMGRIVLTDRDEHELHVRIEDLPDGAQVRLLQMEIREDPPAEYVEPVVLRDELLAGASAGDGFEAQVTLDAGLPSFARVEVWGPAGEPLVFSNPIHFVHEPPADGIPAPRLAAAFDDLHLTGADGFDLTGLSIAPGARRFTVVGNSEPAAGSLEIRTAERGAPAGVRGAASWSWEDGILSLSGFGGESCSVEVSWVTEGPEPPAHPLELRPGRPNPSGAGVAVGFALPERARVRLAVFDVSGKRVRSLLDESRDPGDHEILWDGRGAAGQPVAAGVYFLRLEVDGEVRTRKTVVLR